MTTILSSLITCARWQRVWYYRYNAFKIIMRSTQKGKNRVSNTLDQSYKQVRDVYIHERLQNYDNNITSIVGTRKALLLLIIGKACNNIKNVAY